MYENTSCMSMPSYPPWMWPPGGNFSQPQQNPVDQINTWIKSLDDLKKHFKEEKKDDKKDKRPPASTISIALLMLLMSPITGPAMFYFFQLSLGIIHK